MLNGEVGDTDGSGLGLGQLGQGLPGLDDGDVSVEERLRAVLRPGEKARAGSKGNGPVDKVELGVELVSLIDSILSSKLESHLVYIRRHSRGQARPGCRPGQAQHPRGCERCSTAWK